MKIIGPLVGLFVHRFRGDAAGAIESSAVIGFHIRNYYVTVPEDCVHSSRPDAKNFAITQFRSPAYNFNVSVADSAAIVFSAPEKKAAAG